MLKFEFCRPTSAKVVPAAPEWFHEIKYDGYRMRIERERERVRLITMGGHDWSSRYPWIVEAALKNKPGLVKLYWRKEKAARMAILDTPNNKEEKVQ